MPKIDFDEFQQVAIPESRARRCTGLFLESRTFSNSSLWEGKHEWKYVWTLQRPSGRNFSALSAGIVDMNKHITCKVIASHKHELTPHCGPRP